MKCKLKNLIITSLVMAASMSMSVQILAASHITNYTYYQETPKQGLLHTIVGPRTDVSDITTLDYDESGNLTSVTNALDHSTQIIANDISGRPLEMVSSNLLHTTFQYDVRGRLEQSSNFIENGISGNERMTRYTYTPAGDIETISLPSGETLTWTYDAARRQIQLTNNLGQYITYEADLMGNILSETVYANDNSLVQQQTAVYNQLSQLFQTIGADNQVTQYSYDLNGNKTNIIDAQSNPTTQAFDPLNRLRSILDAKSGISLYAYDAAGKLNTITDPNGNTTSYTYDGFGNVTTLNSPDTGLTTYDSYDEAGNLLQQTNADGITINYTYDALNRLTSIKFPDASQNIDYYYDGSHYTIDDQHPANYASTGLRTGMSDSTGSTSWFYNAYGEQIQSSQHQAGQTYITKTQYDLASGLLISMTYPSGRIVDYGYDLQGQVNQINTTFNGKTDTLISNIQYQPFGGVTDLDYGNGMNLKRSFDWDGRLITQNVTGNSIIQNLSWAYNPVSSVNNIENILDSTLSQSFDYDELDRLSLAETDSSHYGLLGFSYDANGNRIQQDDNEQLTDYFIDSYSDNNQISSSDGSQVQFFQYDDRGNIISHEKNGELFEYHYNQKNRLSQIDVNAITIVQYQYNGLGQRTIKTSDNSTVYYLYNHNHQLSSELDNNGNITRDYLFFDGQPLVIFSYPSSVSLAPESNGFIDFNADSIASYGKNQDKSGVYNITNNNNTLELSKNTWKSIHYPYTITPDTILEFDFSSNIQGDVHGIGFDNDNKVTYANLFKVYGTEKRGIKTYNDYSGGIQHYKIPIGQFYTGQFNTLFFSNDHDVKNPMAQSSFSNIKIYEPIISNIYYYHNDHLGTPQILTDSDQNIVWEGHYSPFGEVQIITEEIENNLRFAGQYFDQESSLHYNYFRYYDPQLGRYITSDPIGLEGGLNAYAYVGGNPLMFIDPYGLERGAWYDPRTYLPLPPHVEPKVPGSGCGDADSDCYVPDFYPEACRNHDQCYSNQNQSRLECDNEFFWDMFVESGPHPNVLVPGIYWTGVRIGGGEAWNNVRNPQP